MAGVMVLLTLAIIPYSYAESEFEQSLFSVFDWINEVITPSIQDGDLNEPSKDNFQATLDSGTEAGKKGVSLWFYVHEFFVNIIFASTTEANLPIDKDLIVIISMLAVSALIIGLVFHLLRENTKILAIVVIILLVLGTLGIVIEF